MGRTLLRENTIITRRLGIENLSLRRGGLRNIGASIPFLMRRFLWLGVAGILARAIAAIADFMNTAFFRAD